jgi:hypothetical protein
MVDEHALLNGQNQVNYKIEHNKSWSTVCICLWEKTVNNENLCEIAKVKKFQWKSRAEERKNFVIKCF